LPVDPKLPRVATTGMNSFPVAEVPADIALPDPGAKKKTASGLLKQMKDDLQYVTHPFKRKQSPEPDTP